MAFLCFIYLTLCGPLGIHSDITTVSKISVKTKDSISIPCHYDLYHKEQVKYLCQGRYFQLCKVVVRATQTETESSRFLIADDTNQGTFTVTINDVRKSDSHFWCAAEVNGGSDNKRYFQLIVTAGTPHLYVDQQEIAAIESGNVTIMCHYKHNKLPKWCRQGSTCVTDASGVIDGVKVNTDLSVPNVFTVIMSELKITSNGWYWCATGELQMPVHVSVGKMPTKITAELSTMRSTTAGTILTSERSSSPAQSTNSTPSGEGQEILQDNHQRVLFTSAMGSTLLSLLFIQLLVVIAVIFGWRMRHYKTKCKDPSIAASPQTGGHELFYSEIVHNRHAGSKRQDRAPKESVIYSTISGRSKQMSKPANEDVVYSTVGFRYRSIIGTTEEVENQSADFEIHGDMDVPLIFLLIVRLGVTYSRTAIIGKVPVKSGGSISIPCVYAAKYRNNVKYLCQGYSWTTCKDVVRTAPPRKPGKYSISDDKDQGIFTVNWKNLGDANRYNWCIVEINGGSDDGEYFELAVSKGNPGLSVESQWMETFMGEKLTIKCQHNGKGRMKWCRLHGTRKSCVDKTGQTDGASVDINDEQNVFTVNLTAQTTASSGWYYFDSGEFQMPVHVTVKEKQSTETAPTEGVDETEINSNNLLYYIIPLTTLIIIAMGALLIWFLYARQKRAKSQSSHNNAEEEVTYAAVKHKKKTTRQPEGQDDNVTYSTVAYTGGSSV